VAAIVYVMAVQVAAAVSGGNVQVLEDVRRIVPAASEPGAVITPAEIAQAVLHTVYMGTSNSTDATRRRALSLAQDVGAYHSWVSIDAAVDAVVTIFGALCGKVPQYLSNGECEYNLLQCAMASVICVVVVGLALVAGGTEREDLALQNIQARLRMVMAYMCAQLLPWVRGQ
jgi:NAD+ synthase (glutamine-hydrolysing)